MPLSLPRRYIALGFLVVCFSSAARCPAQSFIFASPNTRENLSASCALESLNSLEQRNFLAVARYLGARICSKPQAWSAEGLDGPGAAENSLLVTGCQGEPARYLGELLGRYALQKQVLIFDVAPKGAAQASKERLLILTLPNRKPLEVMEELHSHGIEYATLVTDGKLLRIYVWGQNLAEAAAMKAFAANSGAENLQEIAGTGTLVGDDKSRSRAQSEFDRRIRSYEAKHRRTFSTLLWSKKLRQMGLADSGN